MMSGVFFPPPGGKEKWGSGWLVCDDWGRGEGVWNCIYGVAFFKKGFGRGGREDFS